MEMDKIKKHFQDNDHYAKLSGMELIEIAPGKATASMKVAVCHLNGVNMLHGGAIFTLADFALAAASNSHGNVAVSLNVSISYTKASKEGDTVFARAEEITSSRRTGTYIVIISNQDDEKLAVLQATVYKKDTPLPIN